MKIERISQYRLRIDLEPSTSEPTAAGSTIRLGLATSVTARGFGARRLASATRRGGHLVVDDRLTPWPVERLVEFEGTFYLCGPWVDGATLSELAASTALPAPDGPGASVPAWFGAVCNAAALAERHEDLDLPPADSLLITPDHRVLLLDADFLAALRESTPYPARGTSILRYEDPRRERRAALAYRTAALLYHLVTGVALCDPTTEAEALACHEGGLTTPMRRMRPELSERAVSTIQAALADPKSNPEAHLKALCDLAHDTEIIDAIDAAEHDRRLASVTAVDERRRRRRTVREFFRTQSGRIVLVVTALAFISIIPINMIRQATRMPETAGMEPASVVGAWYDAWTALDHILMEGATVDDAGADIIREVSNVFVIQRVQLAQTFESSIVAAPDWLAAGRPEGVIPYGVTDVEIFMRSRGESEAVVEASYTIWRPDTGTETTWITATRVRDELRLVSGRRGWQIVSIAALESEEIEREALPAELGPTSAAP